MCFRGVFSLKSAQSLCLCHRDESGAELSRTWMVIDTGCTKTLLPSSFAKFAVGEAIGGRHRVLLGGKKHVLLAESQRVVHLPVRDVDGRARLMVERCAISSQARYPLLGWSRRPIIRGFEEFRGDAIRVKGVDGEEFLVPIEDHSELPVLSVHNGRRKPASAAGLVKPKTAAAESATLLGLEVGGGTTLTPQAVNQMDKSGRAKALHLLHSRLAHSTGRRLYLTLKEKGWGGMFTVAECKDV